MVCQTNDKSLDKAHWFIKRTCKSRGKKERLLVRKLRYIKILIRFITYILSKEPIQIFRLRLPLRGADMENSKKVTRYKHVEVSKNTGARPLIPLPCTFQNEKDGVKTTER